MSVPESQLLTWSHQGAVDSAEATHASLRTALSQFDRWPAGLDYEVYLQGSYKNTTNIRGDSDVDIVVQLNSTFYYDTTNLTPADEQRFQAAYPGSAPYGFTEFRRDVLRALTAYYGSWNVTEKTKCLEVAAASGRLQSHVVPCVQHRVYRSFPSSPGNYVEGMKFWTQRENRPIINFPKVHYNNGVAKNSSQRTNSWYKLTVRIFKNARTYMEHAGTITDDLAPSYFLESFIYNATDAAFGTSLQSTFLQVIGDLSARISEEMLCQNEQLALFSSTPEQWSRASATALLLRLFELWKHW